MSRGLWLSFGLNSDGPMVVEPGIGEGFACSIGKWLVDEKPPWPIENSRRLPRLAKDDSCRSRLPTRERRLKEAMMIDPWVQVLPVRAGRSLRFVLTELQYLGDPKCRVPNMYFGQHKLKRV